MDTPFSPPADATDTLAPASPERYCINCGYPLRGLPHTGNCPECDTSIALSLTKAVLQKADPDYLRKLLRGVNFILIAFVSELGLGIAALALGAALASSGSLSFIIAFKIVVDSVSFLLAVLSFVGYWFYTQTDPDFIALEPARSSRIIVRFSVIGKAASTLIAFITTLLSAGPPGTARSVATGITSVLAFVFTVALFFSCLRYTRWLASRIPDDVIFARASRYMWLLPLISIVGFALAMSGPLLLFNLAGSGFPTSFTTFYALMIVGGLCVLTAVILYFRLLYGIRAHLARILRNRSFY